MLEKNINLNEKTVLITGCAGFIGSFLTKYLFDKYPNVKIVGLDNINDYYDAALKEDRLKQIEAKKCDWTFIRQDIADKKKIEEIFELYKPEVVINLAAQAGVRYSIDHPDVYIYSNIVGFYNILEACRYNKVEHLVYASSSSVYGANKKVPFSTEDKVDNPVSLYAATKKSNELLAHAYSKLYGIPVTGLRFFTVYGPQGRPDMAYFSFTDKLVRGERIKIFNYGNCERDFTYVDDIVKGIELVTCSAPLVKTGDDGLVVPPYRVYNIGGNKPDNLMVFVKTLAKQLVDAGVLPTDFKIEDYMELVPMQPGDVKVTCADTQALERDFGFKPKTTLDEGLKNFALWYSEYSKSSRGNK